MILYRRVRKFFLLPLQEKLLFGEAWLMTGMIRLLLVGLPFRWLAPVLRKKLQKSPAEQEVARIGAARQIGAIVDTVSRYTPWQSKCLVQACASKMMLRRRGISSTLYLGVRKAAGNRLVAHAWLQCDQKIINGGCGLEAFTVVGQFADEPGAHERR